LNISLESITRLYFFGYFVCVYWYSAFGFVFFKYLMFLAVTIVKMFSVLLILLFSTVLSVVYYIRMARNIVFTFREGLGEYISLRFFMFILLLLVFI